MGSWYVNALGRGFKFLISRFNPYRRTFTLFLDVVTLPKGFIFVSSIVGKQEKIGNGENRTCSPKQQSTGQRNG